MESLFAHTRLSVQRVSAVSGSSLKLPLPAFDEPSFHRWHGRKTNLREVGCYLSHVRAIRAFLDTPDDHGLICEDDLGLAPDFEKTLNHALHLSQHWNILRLTGLSHGRPLKVAALTAKHTLCISLGRIKGAGAYLIDRRAACDLHNRLLPMWLPFDHAIDREWTCGLRAAYVLPYLCSQTESGFPTSIQKGSAGKQSTLHRYLGTYPYQAANESARWLYRSASYLKARATAVGPPVLSPTKAT